MDENAKKILNTLQGQCAKREYCSSDVRSKAIKALEGDSTAAEAVVESLVGEGYVDDRRYAGAFARQKAALDGWGPVKIRYTLKMKGISASDIDNAISSIDAQAAEQRMHKLLAAKARSLEGDPQARFKLIKYALSRGYEYDDVKYEF